MSNREKRTDVQRARLKKTLLMSASGAALLAASVMPQAARAADYEVANETDLRNAITAANGSLDPSSTITLTGNIALSSTAAFPGAIKPITINTNGFTLSGLDQSSGSGNGGGMTFSGNGLVLSGTFRGGGANPATANLGGDGVTIGAGGSVTNNGSLIGGLGGGAGSVGKGGTGLVLTAGASPAAQTTAINNGAITGGNTQASNGSGGTGAILNDNTSLINNGSISAGLSGPNNNTEGYGLIMNGASSLTNHGTIQGATNGGAFAQNSGDHAGIYIGKTGTANVTIINDGSITGGREGSAIFVGIGPHQVTIINSGTLQAGIGSANAIGRSIFTGPLTLELHAGSTIIGNVLTGTNANDVLRLGGNGNDSFDVSTIGPAAQYRGFDKFEKTGASDWTLTGTTSTVTPWNLQAGTLSISSDSNLGPVVGGALTFNGGTLRNTAAFTSARTMNLNGDGTFQTDADLTLTGTIGGAGALNKTGSAALILNGNNAYSGATNVQGGALVVGDAAHTSAALTTSSTVNIGAGGTFGGYGSYTGTINNSGTLAPANAIAALAGSANGSFTVNGTLNNAGVIQIGGQGIGNQLVVAGNYVGQNGIVRLNTYLGGDGSPSDTLVLNGGTATGASKLQITNMGGPGIEIAQDGIQVVQAANGATSSASAFSLAAPVKAGIYQYYLAKGGVSSGTTENWYLRNFVPAASDGSTGTPIPADGVSLPAAGATPIPLYRTEAPIYSEIAGVSRALGIAQIDSFRDRQGDPWQAGETGRPSDAWARVWGGRAVLAQESITNPQFDGTVFGLQAGRDLYTTATPDGHRNRYGLFFGLARAVGEVEGFALGTPNLNVGDLAANAYSLGGYWTHLAPAGWYTDAVLMASALTIDPKSNDSGGASTHGHAVVGSVEAGVPLALAHGLVLEPQAQLVWQRLTLADFNDGFSTIRPGGGDSYLARVGVRLSGDAEISGVRWQPYARANLLRSFGQRDATTFDDTTLAAGIEQTSAQLGAGVVGRIGKNSSVYATLNYQTNVSGAYQRIVMGNAGVRISW